MNKYDEIDAQLGELGPVLDGLEIAVPALESLCESLGSSHLVPWHDIDYKLGTFLESFDCGTALIKAERLLSEATAKLDNLYQQQDALAQDCAKDNQ